MTKKLRINPVTERESLRDYIRGDYVGIKSAGGRVVLETIEEVIVSDGVGFYLANETMDLTLTTTRLRKNSEDPLKRMLYWGLL